MAAKTLHQLRDLTPEEYAARVTDVNAETAQALYAGGWRFRLVREGDRNATAKMYPSEAALPKLGKPYPFPEDATQIRRQTCDGCGRVRKCAHHPRKNTPQTPRILPRADDEVCYYALCVECYPKVKCQDDVRKIRSQRTKRETKTVMAYPVVGGPLDGKHAVSADFYSESGTPGQKWYRPAGQYAAHGREYESFNAAHGGRRRVGGSPTMIFVHTSKLLPLASRKVPA